MAFLFFRRPLGAAGLLALCSIELFGQAVQHNPVVRGPAQFAIGPPLGNATPAPAPAGPPVVIPLHPAPRPTAPLVTDPVVQSTTSSSVMPAASNNFLGVGSGFSGFSVPGAPSDVNLAVGPNHIVQGVNSSYAVFSKTGAVLQGPVTFKSRFTGLSNCQQSNFTDPVIQYDRQADRWILTILNFGSVSSGPYYECIAVSTSGDPTGSYALYAYNFSNLPDYPKLGVWPDAYYATYNMFQGGNTFVGAQACAYNRGSMLSASPTASQQCFSTSPSDSSLLPADLDGATAPPSGAPNYLLSLASVANALSLWTFHVDWTNSANSSFTGPANLAVASYNEACTSGGACIPQYNTSTRLDSLGDRMMYRLAYRNFGGHDALVANHSVNAGSETGVRWYEIRNPGTSPTIYQQGTYAPDSNHRWMASIGMDQSGDIALGFSASSSSIYPEINYTGRLAGDTPLGQMTQGEATIVAGGGSQTTYLCFPFTCALTRWGDYTAMRIDPGDDCTFWYTNQYLQSSGAFNWSTRIASFKFTSCGSNLTATTTALSANPANSSTYGNQVTFTATVTPSGATGTVTFLDGSTTLGTATLSSSGVATYATSSLAGGTHSITATYGGDATYSGSSSTISYTVNPAASTTTMVASSASITYGQAETFTATVSPSAATGTVTFKDGSTAIGTSTLSSGVATLSTSTLAASSTAHSITATYNGSSNYAGGTSSAVFVTVSQANTTTTVSSSSPTSTAGQTVTFTATVAPQLTGTPTGTVTFYDGSTALGTGTLTGGKTTYSTSSLAAGTHQITASYGGDSNFQASTSAAITQTVNASTGDFSISATPGNDTVKKGGTASYTVTITPSGGFSGSVALSAVSNPTGPSPSFSVNPISGGSGTSTMTVPTVGLASATYTIRITGVSGSLSHSTSVTLKLH